MTYRSVPALRFSRNDISCLKQTYKVVRNHFKNASSFSESKYLEHLKIIVGNYVLTLIKIKNFLIKPLIQVLNNGRCINSWPFVIAKMIVLTVNYWGAYGI